MIEAVRPRRRRGRTARLAVRGAVLVACVLIPAVERPTAAYAKRVARRDPIEPLLTTPAFLDQSAEIGGHWSRQKGSDQIELAAGLEWIFWDRLELSAEIPAGISVPDHGSTVGDLSDIAFAAQTLLCCEKRWPIDYLSVRAAVDAPTGDRSKDIGGDGSWEVSVLPGLYFTVADGLPAVLGQIELGYVQQIRLDADARAYASTHGVGRTREKDLIWNIAFAQPWFDGIIQPVFEILGTTTVDAVDPADEATTVELGCGLWFAPHPKEHWLSALSYAIGGSFPVSSHYDDQSTVVFTIEWALD